MGPDMVRAAALPETLASEHRAIYERAHAMFLQKLHEYGTTRYEEIDPVFNVWMCYSDTYRKFIRLRQQVKLGDWKGQVETYMDMMNYCIMAIQIIEYMGDRGDIDV